MDNLTICPRCGSDACYVDEVNKDNEGEVASYEYYN